MARIRSVHPGLWTDDNFVTLSLAARLFLIGMWNEADDYGLFEWKPLRLKMRLSPADAIDASALMDELADGGFLVRLERDGKQYGAVKNFRKFQRPQRPSPPLLQVDSEIARIIGLGASESDHGTLNDDSASAHGKSPQMEKEDGEGEEKEEGEKEAGNTVLNSARRFAPDEYAFSGKVVRLTRPDFDRWKAAYGHLELMAELEARDAWLAGPEVSAKDRKNWFASTSKYLANRNGEAAQRARAGPPKQSRYAI